MYSSTTSRRRLLAALVAATLGVGAFALVDGGIPFSAAGAQGTDTTPGRISSARIVKFEAAGVHLDALEVLSGEAAIKAAVAAGEVEPGEGLPNDVFIDDPDDTVVWAAMSPSATVQIFDCSTAECALAHVSFSDLAAGDVVPFNGKAAVWRVTTEGGTVVALEEIYLP